MTQSTGDEREGTRRPEETAAADRLYRAALAVENDEQLAAEMAKWEEATVADAL